MKATYHLIDVHQSARTGIWNIRFVERQFYRGGFLWLKRKTFDLHLRCFGTPDNWRLVEYDFVAHKDSPINAFCNGVVGWASDPDVIKATDGFKPAYGEHHEPN